MCSILFYILCIINIVFAEHRLVSLTPSITESLYLLGEQNNVVGITNFCRRISLKQRVVGTYLEPNIEEIVRLRPDIVFISKEGTRKEVVDTLTKFGLKVVVLEPLTSYQDIKKELIKIGELLGKQNVAKKVINKYEQEFKISVSTSTTFSMLCILNLHPLIVATNSSYIADIIEFAGYRNCISSKRRYLQISEEELFKLNPDIIIIPDMGQSSGEIQLFFNKFRDLAAVKNRKIFILPSNVLCQPSINNFFIAVKKIRQLLIQ